MKIPLNGKTSLEKSLNSLKRERRPFFKNKLQKTFGIALGILALVSTIFGGYFAVSNILNSNNQASASAIFTCPPGFTGPNSSNQCTRAAVPVCPPGYTFVTSQCTISYTPTYTCPSGYFGSGGSCSATGTFQSCPSGYTSVSQFNGSFGCFACAQGIPQTLYVDRSIPSVISYHCYSGINRGSCTPQNYLSLNCGANPAMSSPPTYRCPNGTTSSSDSCTASASISCPQGGSFGVGARCNNAVSPSSYTCTQGTPSGTTCITPATITDYTTVTDSDIASVSCTPVLGVLGYTVSCTVTTSSPVKGSISFTTGAPGTGTCTANFVAGGTTANCSFPTTNPGVFPVTVASSGGGSRIIPSLTVQCAVNTYLSGTTCLACPTGASSPVGSTAITSCTCPVGQIFNPGSTSCIPATCPNGATNPSANPACTQCPNGVVVSGVSQQCPADILISQVGDSQDCTASKKVIIPTVYTCTFPVTSTGPLVLPAGTVASTITATGVSSVCTYSDAAKLITCTNIPSLNGTPGVTGVNLAVGGTNPIKKGEVTLVNLIDLVDTSKTVCNRVTGSPVFVQNPSVVIGDTYSCQFELSDNTINPIDFPTTTFTSATSVNGGSDITPLSTVTDNTDCRLSKVVPRGGTSVAGVYIYCQRIPTTNGTQGLRNVLLKQDSGNYFDKADVTLIPQGPLLIETANATFTPSRATSKEFKKGGDLNVIVSDPRIVSGASCIFSSSQNPTKSNPDTNYQVMTGSPVTYSTNATTTLTAVQQISPKWRFKIDCTNPATATNGYANRQFVAYPDYSFKYGAIVTIDIGGRTVN